MLKRSVSDGAAGNLLWVWASGDVDGRRKAAPGSVGAAGGGAGREGVLEAIRLRRAVERPSMRKRDRRGIVKVGRTGGKFEDAVGNEEHLDWRHRVKRQRAGARLGESTSGDGAEAAADDLRVVSVGIDLRGRIAEHQIADVLEYRVFSGVLVGITRTAVLRHLDRAAVEQNKRISTLANKSRRKDRTTVHVKAAISGAAEEDATALCAGSSL